MRFDEFASFSAFLHSICLQRILCMFNDHGKCIRRQRIHEHRFCVKTFCPAHSIDINAKRKKKF